jgi:dihydroceramidase
MIYTTCVICYAVFSHGKSTTSRILLSVSLVALAIFITGYYHYLKDPLFHQNMFALLTTVALFRSAYVMEMALRPYWRQRLANGGDELEQKRVDSRDKAILRSMWVVVMSGVGSVAIGFLIWNLDNIFCSTLRRWRRDVGLPWGVLLEGHGWW